MASCLITSYFSRIMLRLTLRKYLMYQNLFNSCRLQYGKWKHQKVYFAGLLGYAASVKEMLFPQGTLAEVTFQYEQSALQDVLDTADSLFAQHEYQEAYNLLEKTKYIPNPEVLWRLCRLLFVMSENKKLSQNDKRDMIYKAYTVIQKALPRGSGSSEVHKWIAVILNAKSGQDGGLEKVKAIPVIKEHLMRALQLNPSDISVLYMLGTMSYHLATLTWLQRKITSILCVDQPMSTLEEAHNYFLRAEILKPRFFISNLYMLGKLSYDMGNYYRAKFYIDIAISLPCRNESERKCWEKAKRLSQDLKQYDLSKGALFFEK